jgi:Flp pilus assembly protein TadG
VIIEFGASPPARAGRRGQGTGTVARTGRPGALSTDDGTVTAESAIAIPSLVVLLMIFVWVILVVTAQLRVVDAARVGARAAARGESIEQSISVAGQAAPPGAEAYVTRSGDEIRVKVEVDVPPPGGIAVLPSIHLDAIAYAAVEATDWGDDP